MKRQIQNIVQEFLCETPQPHTRQVLEGSIHAFLLNAILLEVHTLSLRSIWHCFIAIYPLQVELYEFYFHVSGTTTLDCIAKGTSSQLSERTAFFASCEAFEDSVPSVCSARASD